MFVDPFFNTENQCYCQKPETGEQGKEKKEALNSKKAFHEHFRAFLDKW